MIEIILYVIGFYFLIGMLVMTKFMSNKYVYEGANIFFKLKTNRDMNKFDYFLLVLFSSYLWPKVLLSMILAKISGLDTDKIMKEQLDNVKQQLKVMEEANEKSD